MSLSHQLPFFRNTVQGTPTSRMTLLHFDCFHSKSQYHQENNLRMKPEHIHIKWPRSFHQLAKPHIWEIDILNLIEILINLFFYSDRQVLLAADARKFEENNHPLQNNCHVIRIGTNLDYQIRQWKKASTQLLQQLGKEIQHVQLHCCEKNFYSERTIGRI